MSAGIFLQTMLSIAGIWVMVAWVYRDYRIDLFRQEMFSLRDELFDLGADGVVDFENPAYGALRSSINGFIRFGDRLSLTWGLAMVLALRDEEVSEQSFERRYRLGESTLDGEAVRRLADIHRRVHLKVGTHMALASPLISLPLFAVVLPVLLLASLFGALSSFGEWCHSRFQPATDEAAYAEGCLA